jgi:hypothetical protein
VAISLAVAMLYKKTVSYVLIMVVVLSFRGLSHLSQFTETSLSLLVKSKTNLSDGVQPKDGWLSRQAQVARQVLFGGELQSHGVI